VDPTAGVDACASLLCKAAIDGEIIVQDKARISDFDALRSAIPQGPATGSCFLPLISCTSSAGICAEHRSGGSAQGRLAHDSVSVLPHDQRRGWGVDFAPLSGTRSRELLNDLCRVLR
jgi:hypothetical protein